MFHTKHLTGSLTHVNPYLHKVDFDGNKTKFSVRSNISCVFISFIIFTLCRLFVQLYSLENLYIHLKDLFFIFILIINN